MPRRIDKEKEAPQKAGPLICADGSYLTEEFLQLDEYLALRLLAEQYLIDHPKLQLLFGQIERCWPGKYRPLADRSTILWEDGKFR